MQFQRVFAICVGPAPIDARALPLIDTALVTERLLNRDVAIGRASRSQLGRNCRFWWKIQFRARKVVGTPKWVRIGRNLPELCDFPQCASSQFCAAMASTSQTRDGMTPCSQGTKGYRLGCRKPASRVAVPSPPRSPGTGPKRQPPRLADVCFSRPPIVHGVIARSEPRSSINVSSVPPE